MKFRDRLIAVLKKYAGAQDSLDALVAKKEALIKEKKELHHSLYLHYYEPDSAEIIYGLNESEWIHNFEIHRYVCELYDLKLHYLDKKIRGFQKQLLNITFYNLIVDIRKAFRTRMNFIFKNLDDAHVGVEFFPVYQIQQIHLKHYLTWKHKLKRQFAS